MEGGMLHMRTTYTGTQDGVLVERQWERPDGTWETFKRAIAAYWHEALEVGEQLKKADA
jgi:hypothetical protein